MSQTFSSSAITIVATGAKITTSGTSSAVAIPFCSSGEYPRYIRVAATQPACIKLAVSSAVATTNDTQVQPGDAIYMSVPSGYTSIAAIQVSGAGIVQISALENM